MANVCLIILLLPVLLCTGSMLGLMILVGLNPCKGKLADDLFVMHCMQFECILPSQYRSLVQTVYHMSGCTIMLHLHSSKKWEHGLTIIEWDRCHEIIQCHLIKKHNHLSKHFLGIVSRIKDSHSTGSHSRH